MRAFRRKPNGKRAPLDEKIFATAKFNFGLAVGSDAELPKLAYLFVGKYMNADHGGDAFAAISKYCADLRLSSKSDRAVRVALEAFIDRGHLHRGHLTAVHTGRTTRYSIPRKYFQAEPRLAASRSRICDRLATSRSDRHATSRQTPYIKSRKERSYGKAVQGDRSLSRL